MADTLVVLPLTAEHAADLAALQSEFIGLSVTPEVAAARLARSQGVEHPVLARLNGEVAGFASLRLIPYLGEDAPYAELSELYVRPRFRRRGVARALLETLVQQARAAGASACIVLTGEENDAARAAYESMGFRRFSVALQKWFGDERPYRVAPDE